ncbi:hypothetical protein FS842_002101 [Serendipita sp. 407]|nr:hypothetical protein FS842_002101 [Serendipita sp. 407]
MSRQLKSLNSAYKSLYSAVESCQNEEASNLMKEFAPLITKVKPGDTSIDSPTATRLIDMFEAKLEPLYRLFPANTTCFVIAYFFSLLPQLKLVKLVWQEIACSGLIVGLDTYGLASEEGCAEFHKEFVTGLCKLLSDKDASKLTLDLRYAIGMLLANLVGEQPEAKKVMLDPDVLGVAGLARLFVGSTGFRTTDAYLQIIARLAPPKKEDANRRSYFSSVLCTSACKAMFGTSRARKFVDLINRSGTKAWFERSDLLHAEIGFNNKRSQRYIAQAVFVNGDTYSNKSAALRVYVDLELVIMIFQSPGNEQLMTTSLDNICAIRVEPQADDMSTVTIELKSPLIMQIRNEVASQKSSMSLDFQFSNHEADRFQKVIDSKGLDKKVVKPPKALKQSLSQHATQLGPIAPITPTSLETKTHIIEGYYHSDSKSSRPNLVDPVTVRSSRSAVSSSESSPTCAGGCSKPRSKSDSDSGLSSIDDDASQIRPAIGVRPKRKTRAVILDSDEEQVTMPRKAASPKRKIAELDDNEISISPPGAKRARTSPKIDHDHSQSQNTSSLPAFVLVKEGPFPPSSSSPLLKGPDPHKVDQTGSLDSEGSLNTPKGSSSRHAKSKSSHSLDRVDNELHNGTRQFDYIQRASLGASGVSGELAPPHAQKNLAKQEGAIRGLNYFSEEALQSLRSSRPHLESGVEATTISIDQNRGTRHVNTAKGSAIGHYLDSPDPPSSPIRPAMVLKQKARSALVLKKSPPKTVRKDAPKSSLLRRENQFIFPAHPTGSGTGPERGSMSPVNRFKSVKHMRASIVSTVVNTASPVTKSIHDEEILHRSHVPDVSSRDKTAEIDEELIKIPNEPDRGKEKPSAKRFVRWESTHYPKFEEAMSILKLKKSKTGHNSISEHQMRNAPSLVSANASDSDSLSEDEVPRVPISGIDAIAEVLTAIQKVIMENVGKKVSEVRTEARIARARMVEVAVGDLGAMHESLEGLLGQFFGLDEHYEAVDQAVRAGREQLQGANETVKDILLNIIREHDRITKDDAVFQMPIRQPPKCII